MSSNEILLGMMDSLEEDNSMLTAAIKRLKAKSEPELKDEACDNAVRALFHIVQGALYHPDGIVSSAALNINKKFIVLLNGLAVGDEATYGNFAGTVAQIISDNNITVKKRSKKPEEAVA